MDDKAQIALFFILGFVVVLAVGFIYSMGNESISKKIEGQAEESAKIAFSSEGFKNYLDICLQNIASEGIVFIGKRGGYFTLPEYSYEDSFIKTAYYFYEDKSLMPDLEVLQDSISEYVKREARFCFEELGSLPEIKNAEYQIENVNTLVVKDSVIIGIKAPAKLALGNTAYNFDNFEVRIENRLFDVYYYNKFIIDKQVEDSYSLCLSCIINKADEDDLFVDIENIGNNTFAFTIAYNNTKTNSLNKFIFANKYKPISCSNLPLGADETYLDRLIDECVRQEIEKYNYTFKVEDIKALSAYVGIPFTTKINATGFDLTFIDNTDLFNVGQKTGIIEIIPTEEDVGEYDVLIEVNDGFGNEEFKLINLTISKLKNESN